MVAGPPVDLSAYAGQRLGAQHAAGRHRRHHGRHHRPAGQDQAADAARRHLGSRRGSGCRWQASSRPDRCSAGSAAEPGSGAAPGPAMSPARHEGRGDGGRAWGTTFAQVLCDAGTPTVLYSRRPQLAKALAGLHENPDYLPGIALPPGARRDLGSGRGAGRRGPGGLRRARAVAAGQPDGLGAADPARGAAGQPDQGHRARHVPADERGHHRGARRGPRRGSPWSPGRTWRARSPGASSPPPWWPAPTTTGALALQGACHTPYFRPYTNTDVIGCELGGAVKNVIAIAVGHRGRDGARRQHPGRR